MARIVRRAVEGIDDPQREFIRLLSHFPKPFAFPGIILF
jgi:hypothetical protein